MRECGQSMVLIALLIVSLVGMFLVVLNGGALIMNRMALDRAAEDAAVAGLRTGLVGQGLVDNALAVEEAQRVLSVELGNVRGMQGTAHSAANSVHISVQNPPPGECVDVGGTCHYGPVVEVRVTVTVCPPVWRCVPLTADRFAALETTRQAIPPATPVLDSVLEITPTPTP